METVFTIAVGVVGLIGAAIPVFFKWRKAKRANQITTIAPDDPTISTRRQRVRDLIKARRK